MNSFLALTYMFFLSWSPKYCTPETKYYNSTKATIEIGLDIFDCVHLYTGESTRQVPCKGIINWDPYAQTYYLGIELHKEFNEKFNVKTGIQHTCEHPVSAWGPSKNTLNFASTEFYIQLQGRVPIFTRN